ncbi:type II toxin-antitoxin system Phd/YefM family antitoxin [Prosthecodimorpha staleyi]|uniref:Type II toxin-antitoxin system prevent-host-death family antitoxin n=1 Tax=Prosthecodimorpha staleyi TaxID=2840188 RepID=A0A947GCC0_9HYPH|nr:type II toxin-antitoxin system prevent-host-death family antitoxin [Prosthecodimorpha staleyi]MBT9289026.1 type II toxin-antitoxin system prevent-host-death family antitoxin [Prosthecodimorpha staleyi]
MGLVVTVREAEERIAELLQRVRDGEHVVVTEDGKPIVSFVPSSVDAPQLQTAKVPGDIFARSRAFFAARGIDSTVIHVSPDFDEPLSDDFWEGKAEW